MDQAPILLAPVIKRGVADPQLAAHFRHWHAQLRLLQRERNLVLRCICSSSRHDLLLKVASCRILLLLNGPVFGVSLMSNPLYARHVRFGGIEMSERAGWRSLGAGSAWLKKLAGRKQCSKIEATGRHACRLVGLSRSV